MMSCRGLYVFSHESKLGNAPAQALFNRVRIERVEGVDAPRKFEHYRVTVDDQGMPDGVTLTRLVG
jgi:CRISPR-associated protein Csd2